MHLRNRDGVDTRLPPFRTNGRVGAPALSSLELRLEISKCMSNARLDFLKCLYNRESVLERYRKRIVHLHLHMPQAERCVTLEPVNPVEIVPLKTRVGCHTGDSASLDEVTVFVGVGAVAKAFDPVASVVRLQPLDCCYMNGVDACEHPWGVTSETIRVVFNRKLRSLLLDAGVKFGEFEDEVIECAPEVIANLTDKDRNIHPEKGFGGSDGLRDLVRGVRIELDGTGVRLLPGDFANVPFQFGNSFVCPIDPHETWVKCVREVFGHGISVANVINRTNG